MILLDHRPLTAEEMTQQLFYWLGGTVLVFFLIRPPVEYYRQYYAQYVSNKILYDIRENLYSHLQKLSLRYYSNTRAGEVISRVINDVEQTKNFVMIGLMNVWLDLGNDSYRNWNHVNDGCSVNNCDTYLHFHFTDIV